jgi:hypothetical protein
MNLGLQRSAVRFRRGLELRQHVIVEAANQYVGHPFLWVMGSY